MAPIPRAAGVVVVIAVVSDSLLSPQLLDLVGSPRREQADAVAIGHDLVEPIDSGLHRQMLVDALTDGEGRLDRQREPSHDSEGSETDGHRIHQIGVVVA